mgnify:CR=1 FL=1
MKILHVYKIYYPDSFGGMEATIAQLCASTSKLGVESRIFTLSSKAARTYSYQGIEVTAAHTQLNLASCPLSFSALSKFKQLVGWADIIHYHFPWPFADCLDLLAKVNKPRVMTYQSDIVKQKILLQLYKPLMFSFMAKMDCIVASSPNYLASSPYLAKFKAKVKVIPLGLEQERLLTIDTNTLEQMRSRVGENFFLFVGVLRYYKGLHILLHALKNTNLPLVIAGSGPELAKLQQLAKRLNLTQVKFLGEVSDAQKAALFKLAGATVFPSHLRSEAYGISLLESSICSKPMISSEIGTGTSYINLDKVTGLVVPPNDSIALRNAMEQLAADDKLCAAMGAAAYARYQELFTAESMGEK